MLLTLNVVWETETVLEIWWGGDERTEESYSYEMVKLHEKWMIFVKNIIPLTILLVPDE